MTDYQRFKELAEENYLRGKLNIARHFYTKALRLTKPNTVKRKHIESCLDDVLSDIIDLDFAAFDQDIIKLRKLLNEIM